MSAPTSCVSFKTAYETDTITCEICGINSVHIQCLGIDPYIVSVGKMSWKCDDCASISIASLLSKILPKLDVLSTDMNEVKKSLADMRQPNVVQKPSYLERLTKGGPKSNPFPELRRERAESTASNKSERKKRKLRNQQTDDLELDAPSLVDTEDETFQPSNKVRNNKRKVIPVHVLTGSKTDGNSTLSGVELKPRGPPRRHYFVSRVSSNVTTEILMNYCLHKDLEPIACRELPSMRQNVKSFHLVLPESKMDIAESSDTWPEHVILRRYFLNDEARSWLKTVNDTSKTVDETINA